MNLFLNYGLAWVAMAITLILAIVYMTRRAIQFSTSKSFWIQLNLKLRKYHKELGVLLILVGFIHGYNSSFDVLSFNMGTLAWILSIFLGLNWLFKKPLSMFKNWMVIHRYLTVAFILVLFLHLKEVGGIDVFDVITQSKSTTVAQVDTVVIDAATLDEGILYGTFEDGTYTGSATGFGNNLTVEVVIENNLITSIEIISHNERKSQYYQKAFDTIPNDILEAQSLDVDTVTGATFSSVGIINAVNDALSQAMIEGTLPSDLSLPTSRKH